MPVVCDARYGTVDAPAQDHKLQEENGKAARVPREAHLKVPGGKNGLEHAQRRVARGKGLASVQHGKPTKFCVGALVVDDEFTGN